MKKSNMVKVQLYMSIFIQKWCTISLFSFLFILKRKLFGRSEEKIHRPHHLFFILLIQPNTLQKSFLPIFSPKFSTHPISPPNKHTLNWLVSNSSLSFSVRHRLGNRLSCHACMFGSFKLSTWVLLRKQQRFACLIIIMTSRNTII